MIESTKDKTTSIKKLSKNKKEKKSYSGNRKIYPRQRRQKCCRLYTHLGDVEEIFNPLGVSLGASLESRCCHLILDSSV
jgi:hypothetical protein